jgi:hypothetical protein
LKLPELLQLKYGGVSDALKEIGTNADGVRITFFDFQKFCMKNLPLKGPCYE